MRIPLPSPTRLRGATLVEAVIAVGVLAVAIPLVFGTFVESGKVGMSAEAETRSNWIVPACLAEIDASRAGKPAYFSATSPGQPFPDGNDLWAIGFTAEGRAVGKVGKSDYEKGTRGSTADPVRYIATLSAEPESEPATPGGPLLMRTTIAVEYPAAAPAEKRERLEFHTRIP